MAFNPSNPNGAATTANSQPVNIASDQTVPVSIASVPSHPVTNAGTFATQSTLTAETTKVIGTVNIAAGQSVTTGGLTDTQLRATPVPVSLASTTVTNTVATSLASTTISSGTVTANVGTTNGLALDATLTGGTAKAVLRTAAKGTTVAADTTSTPVDANTQALDVSVKGTVPVTGTFFQATQPVSAASLPLPTGASTETTLSALNTKIPSGLVVTTGRLQVELPAGGTGLTNTELRATAVPVSLASTTVTGSVAVTGALTDTQLRATSVPVSGTFFQGTQPVSLATNTPTLQAGSTTAVTQATAANLNATVVGTGTFTTQVTTNGVISTVNSTAVALGISGVFTGTSEDVTEYADIRVSVFADQISAVDGLQMQQSSNGTNWDISDSYSIPSNSGKTFSVGVSAKFFRIVYTNGVTATTVLRVQTKYYKTYTKGSSVRPQDARTNDNDMEEQLSHLMGYNGTSWDRLRSTVANGLSVDVTRMPTTAVTGTFFQATQPVSAASLPLPTGAATETTLAALNTKVTAVNTGAVTISAALPTGTNTIGSVTAVDTVASGTITAISQNVALALNGKSGVAMQVTGTWVGTLQFEGTVDGTNWVTVNGVFAGSSTPGPTTTTNGIIRLTPSGLAQIRITSTAWTSGTATVSIRASDATGGTFINQSLTAGTNVIGKVGIDQTTPGTTNLVALTAETTKVIGTVNISAGQTIATTGPLTDTQLRAAVVPVSLASTTVTGTVTASATLAAETTKVIGTVNVAAGQTLATVTTVSAVTAITNALPVGANKIGTVDIATAAATAKGTQGTNAVPTQDLKDAGRNQVHYYSVIPVLTSATDTLQSLTGTKAGATVVATTTPAVVTTGKTLRITRLAATYVATATSGYGIVRLRFNTAGLVAITSPVAATLTVGAGTPATANSCGSEEATLGEGLEFAAATGIGISVQGFTAVTATAVGYIIVSTTGYEY